MADDCMWGPPELWLADPDDDGDDDLPDTDVWVPDLGGSD